MNLKKKIKEKPYIAHYYRKIKYMKNSILTEISPEYTSKYLYKKKFNKELDLNDPKTYNEKLMWLKLFWKEPLKSKCADKYEVREFVKEKGEEQCLNELYGVYNNVDEIDWEKLPNKFVLKVNNTCGANIICNDKEKLNKSKAKRKLKIWMKDKFYRINAEMHYKDINPKIICEKYLDTDAGFLPIDYKIYCFNGVCKAIMICTDRESGSPQFMFCDLDGYILPFSLESKESIKRGITKLNLPESIKEMCEIANKLSMNLPFVRIDFYDYNGKAIFGEMTFTPSACLDKDITEEGEEVMGGWINLPINK